MSSIDRKPHVLKREKTLAMPRHVIFFDIETTPTELPNGNIEQVFKLGWACYLRCAYRRNLEKVEWQYLDSELSFWQFVYRHTERKRKLWVISHNLNFDFTVVHGWKYLGQAGFKLKFFHNSGSTSIISVRSRHGSILFADFMNWFAESLAAIGLRLGIPKLKIDFATTDDSYLSTYCKRDVEILLAAFKDFVRFLDGNKISRLCFTIGSTAMAAFLFGYYDTKIYIHNNSEAIDLERESYRGGRTECFYLGELNNETYHVLDINSLYPAVMYHGSFPFKYYKSIPTCSIDTLRNYLQTKSAIAKVLIETDEPAYAVKRNRTIFPTGRFWVSLTTPELVYALNHNHILRIDKVVLYEQAKIFMRYVERFYKLRLDFKSAGVASYVEICKKLLNCLYGKFGQKAQVWEKIGDCPGEPDRTEEILLPGLNRRSQIRYLLGEVWELTGYEECFNSFPAIASQVTGYARMYLYEVMKKCGFGNYYYCDTDSLIVNERGLENLECLINEINLGCLKIEESTNTLNIRGLKDYATSSKQVIKGISKNAVEVSEGVYRQEQWPSLTGLLKSSTSDVYTVKKVTKVLTRSYTKGTVSRDGWITPFELSDSFWPNLWHF